MEVKLLLAFATLSLAFAAEDLLDQYVRHVDRVNRIEVDSKSNSYRHRKPYQRFRRAVDFVFRAQQNDLSESKSERKQSLKSEADRKIASDFTPDLRPYLETFNQEVESNHIERRKRGVFRKEAEDVKQWTHSAVLDDREDVVLFWQNRHQEILFRVEARTRGYVGIGFSPNGGMERADIVIGWVDDRHGRAYLVVSYYRFLA